MKKRIEMIRRTGRTGTTLVLLSLLAFSFIAVSAFGQIEKGKRFAKKSNCQDCHESDKFPGDVKHKPFEKNECLSCHKPHGMVGMLRLKKTGAELCAECHLPAELGLEKTNIHQPAKDGRCLSCHNPHASSHVPVGHA